MGWMSVLSRSSDVDEVVPNTVKLVLICSEPYILTSCVKNADTPHPKLKPVRGDGVAIYVKLLVLS